MSSPREAWHWLSRLLDAAGAVLVVVLCVSASWSLAKAHLSRGALPEGPRRIAEPPLPVEPISLDGAATLGETSARVVLIEFTDFQCPYCAKFAREVLPAVRREYIDTGRVRFAIRHFPLERTHPDALDAARTAACTRERGRFWEFHDLLFAHASPTAPPDIRQAQADVGFRGVDFDGCREGAGLDVVRRDQAFAKMLLVKGTPTFFVGLGGPDGRIRAVQRFSGFLSFDELRTVLNRWMEEGSP